MRKKISAISTNKYSTAGQMLHTVHIDRGEQNLTADVLNLPVITNDAKGARTLFNYDNLQRPTIVWARDNPSDKITKRQIMRYGDNSNLTNPQADNLNGKLYVHNDEAGKLVYPKYGFKGNNLVYFRQVITDDALTAYQKYVVDWDNFNPAHLSGTKNTMIQEYDALNRIRKAQYPEDIDRQRKEMIPKYNKGGALLSLKVDGKSYVNEVAYNARGQRILIAMGNNIMTRYAYDPETFRVSRQRSEPYKADGHTYTPYGHVQQDLQYTYDLEGTITTINDATPANATSKGSGNLLRIFIHDPLRRLLFATGRESRNVYKQPSWDLNIRPQDHTKTNPYTRAYQYDKLGNIQYLSHKAAGYANQDFNRNYSYGTTNNQLTGFTVNSNFFENLYDENGNLIKEGGSRYFEWNANDKMAVFKNQAGNSTPSIYTNYFYNAQGDRIKKHTRKGNKIVVTFYMDGGMFETTYTKTVGGSIDNNRYFNTIKISDDGALIATIQVGNNVDDNTPAIKYIVGDHLNNSTAVLKTTGTLINREEYYPFGETSFGGFQYKRYRYNGKEKDEESGLYEYGQRYYAPWLCRFVSVDPIAESFADLSSYNYAGNMPVSKVDIDGLQQEGREGTPDTKTNKPTTANVYNDVESNIQRPDNTAVHNTDASSDPRLLQESMNAEKAFIDKFGFAPLPKKLLESGEILKEIRPPLKSGGKEISAMIDRLKEIVPEFEGEREKTDHGGYTLTKEGATKSNNSGFEGEPSSHKDVTGLSEAMTGVRSPLKPASGSIDFTKTLVKKVSDIIKTDIDEDEKFDYDFPLPDTNNQKADHFIDSTQNKSDSLTIIYYKRTYHTFQIDRFTYRTQGAKIDTIKGTNKDTINGRYKGQPIIKSY